MKCKAYFGTNHVSLFFIKIIYCIFYSSYIFIRQCFWRPFASRSVSIWVNCLEDNCLITLICPVILISHIVQLLLICKFYCFIYVTWWWEKYLSKRSPLKHTCSWPDKLIVLWILNRQAKIFFHITNLATKITLNAKINEAKGEIPNITNLATKTTLNAAENTILLSVI